MADGAGTGVAGGGIAGLGAPASSEVAASSLPAVLRYDPAARDWATRASGVLATCHPVDQQVALSLSVRLGSVPAYPGLGNEFHQIGLGLNDAQLQRAARAKAEQSFPLSSLLSSGSVELVSVVAVIGQSGRLGITTLYKNLEADPEELRPLYSEI